MASTVKKNLVLVLNNKRYNPQDFIAIGAMLYGLIFQRAANDRRGGWLFGMVFSFLLWMAAPVVFLPMISGNVMAAGPAATGFLASFLVWGACTGALFPLSIARCKCICPGAAKPSRNWDRRPQPRSRAYCAAYRNGGSPEGRLRSSGT